MDITNILFQDVSNLPIITNQRQERWLGIQIKAVDWIDQLCEKAGLDSLTLDDSALFVQTAYRTLTENLSILEDFCIKYSQIQPPKLEAWTAELLSVRRNIFELRRSRFRRYIRSFDKIAEESDRNEITHCAYNAIELLCLLPHNLLNRIMEFEQTYERLPSQDEVADWLKIQTIPENFGQIVYRRARMAQETLAIGYLRYALRFSLNYVGQGLDYLDLAQEGFIGLMKAAERYNHREHVRFAHYATSWIWQGVRRAIADRGRTVRLPVHMQEQVLKLEEACQILARSYQENPSLIDILLQTNLISEDETEALKQTGDVDAFLQQSIPSHCKKTLRRAKSLVKHLWPIIPLDLTIPKEIMRISALLSHDYLSNDPALFDLIPDWDSTTPEALVDMTINRTIVHQALDALTTREQEVIALRFGLRDSEEHTLEEIGQMFGLTRERIRQIETKAIMKLERALPEWLADDNASPIEGPMVYLPIEILAYFDKEFNYWKHPHSDGDCQDLQWLEQLIESLPGGEWHDQQLGDKTTRQDQLADALRTLSAPAHYSEVTEQLNDTIEEELDERYVYSILTRYEQTFILLGQGVFSLFEWEQSRASQIEPSLPLCPTPLPAPPNQNDAFFESVLVAQNVLKDRPTVNQFLKDMFDWAEVQESQPRWFQQSVLAAYYLVGLIPYTFCLDDSDPLLECTLPEMGLHELRRFCLQKLTQRLVAMPEFWWAFQRYQPMRPSALGVQFAEMHPLGLDDTLNRLSILTSLGASQRLTYGQYRLTMLGEELANQWKQKPTFTEDDTALQDVRQDDFLELEPIDLAIW